MKWALWAVAALAAANGAQAVQLRAHDLDQELRTVRDHMQAGEYRYALAYAAHIVAEHRESAEGARLYAWLLQVGGQEAAARRVLKDDAVAQEKPPVPALSRETQPLPSSARVKGSGVLLDANRVLVPLAALECEHVIVRNALGDVANGQVERRLPNLGVAIAALETPMPFDAAQEVAASPPFPGSAGFAVGYARLDTSDASWPTLASGFVGRSLEGGPDRRLEARFAVGARAGIVFDRWGRLLGIALPDGGAARLVPVPQETRIPLAEATARQSRPVEQIYEAALTSVVQVIIGED